MSDRRRHHAQEMSRIAINGIVYDSIEVPDIMWKIPHMCTLYVVIDCE